MFLLDVIVCGRIGVRRSFLVTWAHHKRGQIGEVVNTSVPYGATKKQVLDILRGQVCINNRITDCEVVRMNELKP